MQSSRWRHRRLAPWTRRSTLPGGSRDERLPWRCSTLPDFRRDGSRNAGPVHEGTLRRPSAGARWAAVGQQPRISMLRGPRVNCRCELNPPFSRRFLSGANRDRTGDLLLAKRHGRSAVSPEFPAFMRDCGPCAAARTRRDQARLGWIWAAERGCCPNDCSNARGSPRHLRRRLARRPGPGGLPS
jgi:hypothetical protein